MRQHCIRILTFAVLLLAALPLRADNGNEPDAKPVKERKPVFLNVYAFAGMDFGWQDQKKPDYYAPACNVGGAFSIYTNILHQFRLFVGYEYAGLTNMKSGGRLDSHWVTFDVNYQVYAMVFGFKCQVLCNASQKGALPIEMAGLRTDCFNRVACDAYLGLSFYNAEVFYGINILPILNKQQVAINTMNTNSMHIFTVGFRYNIPLFTTGKRKNLF